MEFHYPTGLSKGCHARQEVPARVRRQRFVATNDLRPSRGSEERLQTSLPLCKSVVKSCTVLNKRGFDDCGVFQFVQL